MRLLLLFDPDYWCSGTERGLRQLPELCPAHGGVAGLEQRGVEQRESPRGRCSWGPSEARCVPLVRLLLLSDPGSWCSGTAGPGSTWVISLGFVPRTEAPLGTSSGAWSSTGAPVDSRGLGPS